MLIESSWSNQVYQIKLKSWGSEIKLIRLNSADQFNSNWVFQIKLNKSIKLIWTNEIGEDDKSNSNSSVSLTRLPLYGSN